MTGSLHSQNTRNQNLPILIRTGFSVAQTPNVLDLVIGEWKEHILRMAMKSLCFSGFDIQFQNANSIVLKFDGELLVLL